MARSLISCATSGVSVSTTLDYPLAHTFPGGGQATEANAQITYRLPGTIDRMFVRITSNSATAASTFAIRKNSGAGNLSISIPSTSTGIFYDVVNSDAVASGDEINVRLTPGSVNLIRVAHYGARFDATTNTAQRLAAFSSTGLAFSTNNSDAYNVPAGDLAFNGTESQTQVEFNTAGTLKNLQINVRTNSRAQASTCRIRKNTANGNLSISIAAAATGILEDTTNSDSVAVDDIINYDIRNAAGGGTLTTSLMSVEFETTNNKFQFLGGTNVGLLTSTNIFWPPSGSFSGAASTDANAEQTIDIAGTASNLWLRITSNTVSVVSEFGVRKNQADTALFISVGASTSGTFEDTDTVTYIATDEMNHEVNIPAGTGDLTLRGRGVLYENTEGVATPAVSGWSPLTSQPYPDQTSVVGY